jgi:multicomponent Na+:H+ antiporter subunit D
VSGDLLLILTVAVPLAGAAAIVLLRRQPNAREAATLVTAALLFFVNVGLVTVVIGGGRPDLLIFDFVPGAAIALAAEPLGALFGAIASGLWFVTSIYSIGYMRANAEKNQTRFYTFFAIALAATMGIAYARNLMTLFVFYEFLSLSTYPLVIHAGTEAARRGGRVYIGILMATSIAFFLFAILWTWTLAGTLEFAPGGILAGAASPLALSGLLALYVFGIAKAGLMPFHRWLPSAMVAPTPVSALLHAVAVVKAGVFAVLKIMIFVFGIDVLGEIGGSRFFLYLAAVTVIAAGIIALRQDNLKRRLAYSTISQLGLIVLAAMTANALGVVGGAMHIATHAFAKITLFFAAGAIYVAAHKTEISDMRGIGRAMPWTMTFFLIGALSVIGLPPAGGLWSKWIIALSVLQTGDYVLLAVLLGSSLLSAGYLMPIVARAFFAPAEGPQTPAPIREAPPMMLAAMGVSAAGCIFLFFWPGPIFRLAALLFPGVAL